MKWVDEPARSTPVLTEADVVVVGSGPGGLAAAIGAARAGVSVVLVERFGCFGGNITAVGVEGFAWYRHENTIDSEGIGIEFEQRAVASGAAQPEPQSDSHALDGEMFKYVADVLVEEAGVEPLLHSTFAAPILDGDAIRGVIVESKSGRSAVLGSVIVDATGDADVAARSGAPVVMAPKEELLAASVMFHLTGVDKRRFLEGVAADPQTYRDWEGAGWSIETSGKEDEMFSPFLRSPFERARRAGLDIDLSTIGGTWGAISDQGDLTYLNVVHLAGIDGTDVRDLTRGEIEGRRQALLAADALRRFTPGCENAKIRNFGTTIGIRETRKLDAVYNLTERDVRCQGRFDDTVGIFPEFIDGYGVLILPTTGRYFEVPYRSMLPRRPDGPRGLLVAGRSIGGDRISHAAVRNMMCCTVTGQGAGVAAATAVRTRRDVADVDLDTVQCELVRQGVRLH